MGKIDWQEFSKSLDQYEVTASKVFSKEIGRIRKIVARHVNHALQLAVDLGGNAMRDDLGFLRHGNEGLRRRITRRGVRIPAYIDASDLLLTINNLVSTNSYGGCTRAAHKEVADLTDESNITTDPGYIQVQRALYRQTDWEDEKSYGVFDAVFLLGWQLPINMVKLP